MNAGVSTMPWGVIRRPRRAFVTGSSIRTWNRTGRGNGELYSFLSFRLNSVSFSRTSLSEVPPKF